jgi:hypothetical protein
VVLLAISEDMFTYHLRILWKVWINWHTLSAIIRDTSYLNYM